MKSSRAATILSLFVLVVLVVSSFSTSSGKIYDSILNPVASSSPVSPLTVNPVSPVIVKSFSASGLAPSTLPVILTVAIPLNNLGLLQSMTAAISNPESQQYRQFLTQGQIQQLFLPLAQFQSTLQYLQSAGFTIDTTAEDSMIVASGTAGLLQSSLGLQTNLYSNGTVGYYSASGSPTLPGIYAYSSNVTALLVKPHPIVPLQTSEAVTTSEGVPNFTSPAEAFPARDLQSAYNASSLVSAGYNGRGKTIGIFEVTGDPYIAQELAVFDNAEGLPAPPSLKIVPVGPNNPNEGVTYFGIPGEEDLDVEVSHSMAPGANITIYSADEALPESPVIAFVDQQDSVNTFTESYSYEEDDFSFFGPSFFAFNGWIADQYFALGSAEGISFMVSSGDGGGSGYAAQPYGTIDNYADSPYVTAVGGTTTYLTFGGSSVVSSYQTAWSNGITTPYANSGGSTGGVSTVYPRPWYQAGISIPASYPNGRMEPDISLNGNCVPGIFVVSDARTASSVGGYVTFDECGTSESSPLYAGLLADIESRIGGSLGLVNPSLYQMASSPSSYSKDFTPITYGFNTPWVDSYGYNLVTGLGAPNIGNMVGFYLSHGPATQTSITLNITNSKGKSQFEFPDGQSIGIRASVSSGTDLATNLKTLTAELVTLQGTVAKVALTKTAGTWTGKIITPAGANGISYVNVNGSGSQAFGFAEIFTGYFATFNSPAAIPPVSLGWSTALGFKISVSITSLEGKPITAGSYSYTVSSYSILSNTYSQYLSQTLKLQAGLYVHDFTGDYPIGATVIVLQGGAYGFDSFNNGADLSESIVLPPNGLFPSVASPGQYLEVTGNVGAPQNTPNIISSETGLTLAQTISLASNVTASLVSPSGKVVSTVDVGGVAVPITSPFPANYLGYLQVPTNAAPGLYTILFNSSYQSIDLNGLVINGAYFAQVMVADQPAIIPTITLTPNPVGEGQTVTINANIAYANGTEVKFGDFSASLYPAYNSNDYADYSSLSAGEVQLWYSPSLNLWVGNVTMPSDSNLGWIGGYTTFDPGAGVVSQPVSGQWYAYVSGFSADGVPTTTDESAQVPFTVTTTPVSPAVSSGSGNSPASTPSVPNSPQATVHSASASITIDSFMWIVVSAGAVVAGVGISVVTYRRRVSHGIVATSS